MYTILKDFLSLNERLLLVQIAEGLSWEKGRQETGYEKASLRGIECLAELVEHARSYLLPLGANSGLTDTYLLRYPDGSYIPPHKDEPTIYGKRHKRLNALVKAPGANIPNINPKPSAPWVAHHAPDVILAQRLPS